MDVLGELNLVRQDVDWWVRKRRSPLRPAAKLAQAKIQGCGQDVIHIFFDRLIDKVIEELTSCLRT